MRNENGIDYTQNRKYFHEFLVSAINSLSQNMFDLLNSFIIQANIHFGKFHTDPYIRGAKHFSFTLLYLSFQQRFVWCLDLCI